MTECRESLYRLILLPFSLLLLLALTSCVSTTEETDRIAEEDATPDVKFAAWGDPRSQNPAVAKLHDQADQRIKYRQWDEARIKLERALRVATDEPGTWSRLAWLAFRAAEFKKSIRLADRSNSLTRDIPLLLVNMRIMQDAYQRLGDVENMKRAGDMIARLRKAQ